MKVLQINSVCGIGSTGRIATDIHKILISQGHESYIAYGRGEPRGCDNTIKIGTKLDNYFHVAKTRSLDQSGFGSKRATKKFIERIKQIDPDIIHLHNIHGYYINIKILFDYLKKANKRVIWTLHDCWSFTGHCVYFDYVHCNKWKTGCYKCPEKKVYPNSWIIDNSKNNYRMKKEIFTGINNLTIVTPSKWLANLVKESFLKEYPVEMINNGIDLNIFKPIVGNFRKNLNLEDKFLILGVGSIWDRRKGLKYYIELSKRINMDEKIILVGLTEKQLKKIPKNIIGISKTNNPQELAEIYTTSDVFINLTLEDNFPTTILEALACGTPAITFNTGGSPECIDQSTGMVVEKKDINGLLEKIKIIKKNKKSSYSEKTIDRATALYNKEEKFNEYLAIYEKMKN